MFFATLLTKSLITTVLQELMHTMFFSPNLGGLNSFSSRTKLLGQGPNCLQRLLTDYKLKLTTDCLSEQVKV